MLKAGDLRQDGGVLTLAVAMALSRVVSGLEAERVELGRGFSCRKVTRWLSVGKAVFGVCGSRGSLPIARSSGNAIGAIPTAFALSSFDFSGERRSQAPQDSSWMGEMVSSDSCPF